MYLLDTNVVSEFIKTEPERRVVHWVHGVDEGQTFLSVISLAEIRRGIELLAESQKKSLLNNWLLNDLIPRFDRRAIDVTRAIAEDWGRLMATTKRSGVPLGTLDAFIAATARVYSLVLVTRNTKDFAPLGLTLTNPWLA